MKKYWWAMVALLAGLAALFGRRDGRWRRRAREVADNARVAEFDAIADGLQKKLEKNDANAANELRDDLGTWIDDQLDRSRRRP